MAYQLFANDAYSNYNSLQTTLVAPLGCAVTSRAPIPFLNSIDATSSGNTAFNTAYNDESTIDASRGLPTLTALTG